MRDRDYLYNRLKGILPENIKQKIKIIRLRKSVTKILGPRWRPNPNIIAVVTTYDCNLKCLNCNQSCRQAPSKERMSVAQIEKFISESKEQGRRWRLIRILGGEPVLHPNIFEIIQLLIAYKNNFSRHTSIDLYTNGFGPEVKSALLRIPEGIRIRNSEKNSINQNFFSINVAPLDLKSYENLDYSNGCHVPTFCGIGLTPFGYYHCEIAGSIDRVFGFDLSRKKLPRIDDPLLDQYQIFCKYCGYFKHQNLRIREEAISPTWKQAYETYNRDNPTLRLY